MARLTSGLSSMRRLADRLLAALRRRVDRPGILPPAPLLEIAVWVAAVPSQPDKHEIIVSPDPSGVTPERLAQLLTAASSVVLARAGLLQVETRPPAPTARQDAGPVSIARSHPYQRVKGKR